MRGKLIFCLLTSIAFAQNWPSFRGDRALGVVEKTQLPSSWDVEKGRAVAWKVLVPGLAHSSPIVWGDRIYITTAVSADPNSVLQFPLKGALDTRTDTSKHQFRVMALEKSTGKVIGPRSRMKANRKVARHPHNSYAAATPATDGKHLVAFFGSEGLYTYDLDGKLLWKHDVGILDQAAFDLPEYKWGYASSPIIYKNLAIIQCDQIQGSFLEAFDIDSGKAGMARGPAGSDSIVGHARDSRRSKTGDELIAQRRRNHPRLRPDDRQGAVEAERHIP